MFISAIKLIFIRVSWLRKKKFNHCYKEGIFMTSIKQRMIQFALMLGGLVSLGSIDVSNAQFLDSFRPRNTVTADVITRTPVGTRVELTGGSIKSNVRRAEYVFQDRTGRTRVRIEREVWRGREISTRNVIEIRGGRVENDVRGGRFIDVYYFKVIK
ncbi:hypothetical protein Q644_24705 [Brucella intermedia 229E]|uniref:Uncharacterized protein n=1 Tax=Brucella intermedia 229E TaxID=1337887 RepID=U4V755_9HYPH|nr:hypothetical protein Q644_24705 [Brucella intermedia 229E]